MTRTSVRSVGSLMLICSIAAVVPAAAQHFKQMNGSLTQIAAGRNEVWGLNGTTVYRFKSSTQTFAKVSVPNSGHGGPGLTQIAVGGGTLLQKDEVWGVDVSGVGGGPVYHFNFSTNKFDVYDGGMFGFTQIAVGPGYLDNCHPYEVWGIVASSVFPQGTWRYNYCISGFESIPNPSPSGTTIYFSQIATGGSLVWGVGQDGNAYPFLPPSGFGAPSGDGIPFYFEQMAVGPNDYWGVGITPDTTGDEVFGALIDYASNQSLSVEYFITTYGGSNSSTPFQFTLQVADGGDGVFAITYNPDGSTGVFCATTVQTQICQLTTYGFTPVPGIDSTPSQIAVGSGAGVWAIDTENRVYAFVRP